MKKLPLVLLVLSLATLTVSTQTKKTSKKSTKKTSIQPSTTPTPTKITQPNIVTPKFNIPGLEAEVFAEINKMRTNPAEYVKMLEDYLKTFKGNEATTPDGVELITNEGKVPVEELIAILKQTQPLSEFKLSEGITKAAKVHAQDLVTNNKSGHKGTDGSLPDMRVAKFGYANTVAENISYFTKTARAVVLTLLIDDGTPSRSHRKNLLSDKLKSIGIATGENKAVGNFCIIVFADNFTETKGGVRSF